MNQDLKQLAQRLIEGEWHYSSGEKVLKKVFASDTQLSEMGMLDQDGYMHPSLKAALIEVLGSVITDTTVGPFGDNDIFSGDVVDKITYYNIELHHVTDETLTTLSNILNITVKTD